MPISSAQKKSVWRHPKISDRQLSWKSRVGCFFIVVTFQILKNRIPFDPFRQFLKTFV